MPFYLSRQGMDPKPPRSRGGVPRGRARGRRRSGIDPAVAVGGSTSTSNSAQQVEIGPEQFANSESGDTSPQCAEPDGTAVVSSESDSTNVVPEGDSTNVNVVPEGDSTNVVPEGEISYTKEFHDPGLDPLMLFLKVRLEFHDQGWIHSPTLLDSRVASLFSWGKESGQMQHRFLFWLPGPTIIGGDC